jgi:hypothetical protein
MHFAKETGFSQNLWAVTKYSRKNPVSGPPVQPKKPGFLQNLWAVTKYFRKNPVSGPPVQPKKPGFLQNLWAVTKYFREKPGFWAPDIHHQKNNCKNMLQCFEHCVTLVYIRLKLSEVSGHGKQRCKSWLHRVC